MSRRRPTTDEDDLVEAPPGAGHNSVQREELLETIKTIEAMLMEKQQVGEDIKEAYGVARVKGFDTKILRKVIMLRAMDQDKRRDEQELLDTYLAALGIE